MQIRFAFAGFRHSHIISLYKNLKKIPGIEITAACEADSAVRKEWAEKEGIVFTHTSLDAMLAEVACDAVAVGDYYANRGQIFIKSLQAGKHVITDKPLCTKLEELDEIERLATGKNLKLGCQLTMRDTAHFRKIKEIIRSGELGDIQAISFGGQHPLLLGKRPGWYFEPGKHGGTINDIGIHAIDLIEWLTGYEFVKIVAARSWNGLAKAYPFFHDAGQFMLTLSNGCGVMGDVSYFIPDNFGYKAPFYWRFTFWGGNGVLETDTDGFIRKYMKGQSAAEEIKPEPTTMPGYLQSFLSDIDGRPLELDTKAVLNSSRKTLLVQKAADEKLCNINFK